MSERIDKSRLNYLTSNIGDIALKRRVIKIITELELKLEDKVLDCGCGDGLYLKTIKELGKYNIIGFDLDGNNLKLAQGYINNNHVPFIQGNICNLPFKDETFDKIFSTEVLEHVPDDKQAAKEIHRVMKSGGTFIVTVPNHNYPLLWDPINWFLERITGHHIQSGFWAGLWNMHLRLYHPEEIESLIKEAGFKIISIEPLTHYCVPFNHIVLYGLKKVLNTGVLPEGICNTSDKFSVNKEKQSRMIRLGYNMLNLLDRLNDQLPKDKSSVAILVIAIKL